MLQAPVSYAIEPMVRVTRWSSPALPWRQARTTAAYVITAITPTSTTAGVATSLMFTGTVAADDLVVWTTTCPDVVPSVDPADGTSTATSFTVSAAGSHKLCYRVNGAGGSVER